MLRVRRDVVGPGVLFGLALWWGVLLPADRVEAYPGFSRKYKTSCVTCHTPYPRLNDFGHAFRLNGYRMPGDDREYIEEEPVELGAEAWKRAFPEAVWPGDIAGTAPIGFQIQSRFVRTAGKTGREGALTDFSFPTGIGILASSTLGEKMAYWTRIQIGGTGGEAEIERAFLIYNDPIRGLPGHALNLRVGRMEPGAVPYSGHYGRLTLTNYLYASHTVGDNPFSLEPAQNAIEAYGVLGGRFRYHAGLGTGTTGPDPNSSKDGYARIALKLGGLRFDGETGKGGGNLPESGGNWVDNSVTLGVFGYQGLARITDATTTQVYEDEFTRLGADLRLNWRDLDVIAGAVRGNNENAFNSATRQDVASDVYFVEADLVVYPWLICGCRYEQLDVEGTDTLRVVPSATALLRANAKLIVEGRLHPSEDQNDGPDQFLVGFDVGF